MLAYLKTLALGLVLRFVPSAITVLEWILNVGTVASTAQSTASPVAPPPTSSSTSSLSSPSHRERKLSRQVSLCAPQRKSSAASSRRTSRSTSSLSACNVQLLDRFKPSTVIADLSEPFENLFTLPNDLFSLTNLIKNLLLEITFLARLHRWLVGVRERWRTMFRWRPTSPEDLDQAEQKIFSFLKCNYKSYYVDIGKAWDLDNVRLWTIEIPRVERECKTCTAVSPAPSKQPQAFWQQQIKSKLSESVASGLNKAEADEENLPLVMMHGFAAGVGFWALNFDELAEYGNRTIYAFDVLGFAKSSRPKYTFAKFGNMTALQRSKAEAEKMEEYLVESIEKWRKAIGGPLESKFILLGHSFGAYLSIAYALRYPQHVAHLILADPWGLPPENHSRHLSSTQYTNSRQLPFWMKAIAKLFLGVFTPLSLLRALGPWGPGLIHRLRPDIRKKFQRLSNDARDAQINETEASDADISSNSESDDQIKAKVAKIEKSEQEVESDMITDYIYHCNAQSPPSGEIAFQKLCTVTAWARMPMLERIIDLEPHISITFIYGSRSWVDRQSGFQAKYILATASSSALSSPPPEASSEAEEVEASSSTSDEARERVSVLILHGAGHHVYADMPEEFNQMVLKVCSDVDGVMRKQILDDSNPEESEDDDARDLLEQSQRCKASQGNSNVMSVNNNNKFNDSNGHSLPEQIIHEEESY